MQNEIKEEIPKQTSENENTTNVENSNQVTDTEKISPEDDSKKKIESTEKISNEVISKEAKQIENISKEDNLKEEKQLENISKKEENSKEIKQTDNIIKETKEDNSKNSSEVDNNLKKENNKLEESKNSPPTKDTKKNESKELIGAKTKENKNENTQNIQKKNQQNENNESNKEEQEEYDSDNSALSNSDLSDNEMNSLKTRTLSNKKMSTNDFYKQDRQYFIMNAGGTPIYSRYGDEVINCSIFATFSAIITKFTVFNGGENEHLNYIKNEYSLIVFIKKEKIFLIAVSNKNDSVSFLYNQLELLYHVLLSIITNERMPALAEQPSTCAKFILDNNPLFEQIIEVTTHSLAGILKSYFVLPVDNRNKLNEICSKYRGESLFICLLAGNDKEILAMNKSSVIEISSSDMLLIQCQLTFKISSGDKEIWMPICLPGISADGLLQLYYNYDPSSPYGILYITEKQESTSMSTFTELAQRINDEIKEKGFLPNIEKTLETKKNADNIKEEILNNPQEINVETLKAFLKNVFSSKSSKSKLGYSNEIMHNNTTFSQAYKNFATSMVNPTFSSNLGNINNNTPKSKIISIGKIACKQSSKNDPFLKLNFGIIHHRANSQHFLVNLHSYENVTKEEKYIMKTYIKLYNFYLNFKNFNIGDNFFHIEKDKKFSHGIYVTESYIIFGTLNVFKPTNEINDVFKDLAKVVKQYESNLFVCRSKVN